MFRGCVDVVAVRQLDRVAERDVYAWGDVGAGGGACCGDVRVRQRPHLNAALRVLSFLGYPRRPGTTAGSGQQVSRPSFCYSLLAALPASSLAARPRSSLGVSGAWRSQPKLAAQLAGGYPFDSHDLLARALATDHADPTTRNASALGDELAQCGVRPTVDGGRRDAHPHDAVTLAQNRVVLGARTEANIEPRRRPLGPVCPIGQAEWAEAGTSPPAKRRALCVERLAK